ncbi:MAG TPA: hypothetical protein VGO27_19220 [Candidatus Acidoferrum sp.]|nr:hypothetical protein [Candidatus Acidoferrum sp.]
MNREQLNWLLQTIKVSTTAEHFVEAQYESGRISFQAMTDVVRERFLISRNLNQFFSMLICDLIQYASTKLPIAIS